MPKSVRKREKSQVAKKRIKLIKFKIKEDKILNQLANGGKKVKKPKRTIKFYRIRNHSYAIFALIGKYCCACLPLAPLENGEKISEEKNDAAQKRKWDPDWDLKTVTAGKYIFFSFIPFDEKIWVPFSTQSVPRNVEIS